MLEIPRPHIFHGDEGAALSRPAGTAIIHFPFKVAEQNAHHFALERSFVPVPMIAGIAFLNRPDRIAKSPLLAVKILVPFVRDGQAEIALPLLILPRVLFVLLAEKVLVFALGDVKGLFQQAVQREHQR